VADSHTVTGAETEAPRVLLVEDDEFVRQTILWTLEDEGIGAMAATDGQEAIGRLEATKPDLVLLDIGLPVVDGFGVADRLRALYGAALPVVVLTADGRAAEKARRVGAVAYLHKPFEIHDLVRTVRGVLEC
jgi:CheY-like chemotaxis protein